MINNKTVLAIILARGGSKGVPRKNLRKLAGKPLIVWSIEAAKQSQFVDCTLITSDDDEILMEAKKAGCEVQVKRPAEFARDDTPSIDPILHAINLMPGYDYVVLLQPTSPLRLSSDIDACIQLCEKNSVPAVVSLQKVTKHPLWMFAMDENNKIHSLLAQGVPDSRQNLPSCFVLNGAVYVAKIDWLLEKQSFFDFETRGYVMPKERSFDIDTELDFFITEQLMRQRSHQ